MKINSGNVTYRKLTANSGPTCEAVINGNRMVTKITITIIILNAIIRYLNFNVNTPFGIIKETLCYVNLMSEKLNE